jgi:hypothetical protein
MSISEDNIILLPVCVFIYDRLGAWKDDIFYIRDKNNNIVFKETLTQIDYKKIYNINLREGKYNVDLYGNDRNLITWDIYINDNGVLKNIGSSDNYKSEIDDDCEPDTFILSLNEYNKQSIVNSDSANIKSATIDELQVNSIQFSNIPLNLGIKKFNTIHHNSIYTLSYGKYDLTRKFTYSQNADVKESKKGNKNLIFSYPVKK